MFSVKLLKVVTIVASLALGLLVFVLGQEPASAAVQYTFYASPSGSGTTCSFAAPCSLTGARDKVRTVNAAMIGDIVVNLRGGTYALTSPFALTADGTVDDSGFNGHDVIYQAYPGETPVLSGGTTITGTWTLTNPTLNIYSIPVPSTLDTLQLYVNGQAATLARGQLNPSGFAYAPSTGKVTITNPDYTGMASWRNPSRILMSSKSSYKYMQCPVGSVGAGSGGSAVVSFQQPCGTNVDPALNPLIAFSFNTIDRVENAYELLDTAGEFYLDKAASTLYYIPRAGQNMATATVVAPTLETLMTGTGDAAHPLHNVQVSGITFSYATWLRALSGQGYAAVQGGIIGDTQPGGPYTFVRSHGNVIFHKAEHVVISGDTFRHLGGVGLQFEYGPQHNTIIGNVFDDVAASAINLGHGQELGIDDSVNAPANLKTYDNLIKDNYISNVGARFLDVDAIYVGYSDSTTVTHNEIYNTPYTAIHVGSWGEGFTNYFWTPFVAYSQNNTISNNRIDGFMGELQDGGGIYTMGIQPGSTMTGNYVSNLNSHINPTCLYLDAHTEGYLVDSNVLQACPSYVLLAYDASPPPPPNDPNSINDTVSNNFYSPSAAPQVGPQPSNTYTNNVALTDPAQSGAQSIIANAGLESTYQSIKSCATEGNTCSFDGTKVVSYGSGSTYVQARFTGSVLCSSSVFGDPTPGVAKHCEFDNQDIPTSNGDWTYCGVANIGQTCSFSGTKTVAVGANGRWAYKTFTGSTACNNSVIGNPNPNVYQRCYVLGTAEFTDGFASGANWTPNTGSWTASAGAYTESVTGANTDSVITGRTWTASITEFDVVLGTSGAGANGWVGAQIRKTASTDNFAQSGYLVLLTKGGVVDLYKPGTLMRSVQTGIDFSSTTAPPTHVRIVAVGSYIAVYLNYAPVPVVDATDSTYSGGYTSLATSWASGSYDNVAVLTQ